MKYLFILIAFTLMQCTSEQQNQRSPELVGAYLEYDEKAEMEIPRTGEPSTPPDYDLEKGSKIIKNGNLQFEVENLKKAKGTVDSILKHLDAYYENEQFTAYDNHNSYTLVIRIPNTKFDTLVDILENSYGKLISKNISIKDVTEEYVDLNIRLNNNTAYLNQYQQILKKANSIKEILEVQEKIRAIEEEIESKKGRINYLDNKVDYSTLHLLIIEKNIIYESEKFFSKRLINALSNGFQSLLSFIVALVHLWPFFIFIAAIWLFRIRIINVIKWK